jgi:hypothetical protein
LRGATDRAPTDTGVILDQRVTAEELREVIDELMGGG